MIGFARRSAKSKCRLYDPREVPVALQPQPQREYGFKASCAAGATVTSKRGFSSVLRTSGRGQKNTVPAHERAERASRWARLFQAEQVMRAAFAAGNQLKARCRNTPGAV